MRMPINKEMQSSIGLPETERETEAASITIHGEQHKQLRMSMSMVMMVDIDLAWRTMARRSHNSFNNTNNVDTKNSQKDTARGGGGSSCEEGLSCSVSGRKIGTEQPQSQPAVATIRLRRGWRDIENQWWWWCLLMESVGWWSSGENKKNSESEEVSGRGGRRC